MFSYFGSKSKIVHLYPSPTHDKIIEPFAGSARYSLRYYDRDVTIVDKFEIVYRIWKWLQQCSKHDILSLPEPKPGETINRNDFDCIEAAWLMGYMIQGGVVHPGLTVSPTGNFGKAVKRDKIRIANSLWKIKHWKIIHGSYLDLDNTCATWFIDPPYQFGGEYYRESNKGWDYGELARWCQSRNGQVIVCENTKADWLPFLPMKEMRGSNSITTEAIWTNYETHYHTQQLQMFEPALTPSTEKPVTPKTVPIKAKSLSTNTSK